MALVSDEGLRVAPLFAAETAHPVVIMPTADNSATAFGIYAVTHRADLDVLLRQRGGILFRGFDLRGAEDFRTGAERLGATPYGYVGGNTPRTNVAVDIFTSTEYPATEVIGLHQEMSYLPHWPRRLFFYSLVPARTGGQTSLASSRDILRALAPRLVDRLRQKKITYIRHFHPSLPIGKSWQETYQTTSRDEVSAILSRQASTCDWLAGEVLRVTTRCEAVTTHPVTGEAVWFNQAEQWHSSALDPAIRAMFEELVGSDRMPHHCEYGDGDPLEADVLAEIRMALTRNKLLFDWQRHDLLMLDNVLMMHGREAFTGERKTLAYLSET